MSDEANKVPAPEWKDTDHGLAAFMDDVCLSVQDVPGVWWWSVTSEIEVTLGGECSTKERAMKRAEHVAAELWRAEQYNALCAKVAELQAAIPPSHVMLPGGRVVIFWEAETTTTADGKIVGPDYIVWHPEKGKGTVYWLAGRASVLLASHESTEGFAEYVPVAECYSNFPAAEAARGGE